MGTRSLLQKFARILFGLTLSWLASFAFAEEWYFVGSDTGGDRYYVDVEQLIASGDRAKAWVREDYKDPKYAGFLKSRIVQTITKQIFDCGRNQAAMVSKYERDSKGEVVSSAAIPDSQVTFAEFVPGSIGTVMLKFACGRGRNLASQPPSTRSHLTLGRNDGFDWRQVGLSNDGDKIFVDADRVVRGTGDFAGLTFFYQQWLNKTVRVEGAAAIRSSVSMMSTDCSARNLVTHGTASFADGGALLFRWEEENPKPIQPVARSLGASSVEFACAQVATQPKPPPNPSTTNTNASPVNEQAPRDSIGSGTAWYMDAGYFVTANHVIAGAKEVYIAGGDKKPLLAVVVASDSKNDVAILKVDLQEKRIRPLSLAKAVVGLGSRVFTIGYPHFDVLGVSPKVTSGEVAGNLPLDPTKLLISVPIQSGNSGGPLVNMNGEVVGLVIEKLAADVMLKQTGDVTENTNFALKAKYIDALIEDLPRLPTAIPAQKAKPSSIEELVGLYRDSVFLVLTLTPAAKKK